MTSFPPGYELVVMRSYSVTAFKVSGWSPDVKKPEPEPEPWGVWLKSPQTPCLSWQLTLLPGMCKSPLELRFTCVTQTTRGPSESCMTPGWPLQLPLLPQTRQGLWQQLHYRMDTAAERTAPHHQSTEDGASPPSAQQSLPTSPFTSFLCKSCPGNAVFFSLCLWKWRTKRKAGPQNPATLERGTHVTL